MTPTLEAMAREAGATVYTNRHFKTEPATAFSAQALARFAALVRAQALEDAAKVADKADARHKPIAALNNGRQSDMAFGRCSAAESIAAAIRALP